jgi:RimJ/RimL family protein N-acetyltransferase
VTEVPELRTERLLMREFRDEDHEPFAALLGHPEVSKALGHDEPITPADAWREMAMLSGHWQLKGFGHWVLEALDTGEILGRAGLFYPPDWPALEVGWALAREHWGKGYATEAARAACNWAHEELGARHIISLIQASNSRSIRVAERLGETLEGEVNLRGFELLVYGADLPLSGSPPSRAGTPAA